MNTAITPNIKKEGQEPYLRPKYNKKKGFNKYYVEYIISITGLIAINIFVFIEIFVA